MFKVELLRVELLRVVVYRVLQYCTVLYCTVQYSTVQYSTVPQKRTVNNVCVLLHYEVTHRCCPNNVLYKNFAATKSFFP